MKPLHSIAACLLVVVAAISTATGRNIDLSTVPDRQTVQLTIYNSEDLTLVRETRKVTFKKGNNPLQFSWANTLIDPTSVELTFKTNPDRLALVDTTFPHDKPQMLYWNVQSDVDSEATIQITYFTSGISWSSDYVCIADADETQMSFEGFVRVLNNSGEDYEGAQVRLVVGTINLVEKIAQLAQIPIDKVSEMREQEGARFKSLRKRAARDALAAPAEAMMAGGNGAPKQVIKEGLSEYFIYTIEGTETIPNGWSKRMRSFDGQTVPFRIQYRYRPAEHGDHLVRLFLLTNNEESKLGTTPLPDGVVRVFRDNGRDGLSFVALQSIKYVPIGDKIELNLGTDPRVNFELIKLSAHRDNIWVQIHGANVLRRVDQPGVQVDIRSTVAGWDDHSIQTQRIRNYTDKQIEVEVRRAWPGHVRFRSTLPSVKLHDFRTVQFTTTLEAGLKQDNLFEVVTSQGRNQKQNNVILEEAEIRS